MELSSTDVYNLPASDVAKQAVSKPTVFQESTSNTAPSRTFRYPLAIMDKNTDYIKIDCYKYEPPGLNLPGQGGAFTFAQNSSDDTYKSLGSKQIRGTLILPIPQTMPQNGQAVKWGDSTMGPAATIGLGIAMKTITSGDFFGGLGSSLVATALGIKNAATTKQGQETLQTFFAAKGVEGLLGQDDLFNTALSRRTGLVFNENIELLFRGISLRGPFDLTFDLAPRDAKESKEIKDMVVFLKKEMSARKGKSGVAGAGLFLSPPSVFKVQYMNGGKPHPYLNKFKMCALAGLTLNFTSSNTYTTYSDGTPVHMTLNLQFQELTPIYNEDYASAGETETGVGY